MNKSCKYYVQKKKKKRGVALLRYSLIVLCHSSFFLSECHPLFRHMGYNLGNEAFGTRLFYEGFLPTYSDYFL